MTEKQTISWIFLSIAIASENEPTDVNGISMIADGINHAIPTQKELQTTTLWLINQELIVKKEGKFVLTSKGKGEYDLAKKDSNKLLEIWYNLEIKL